VEAEQTTAREVQEPVDQLLGEEEPEVQDLVVLTVPTEQQVRLTPEAEVVEQDTVQGLPEALE